jgi:hypothetical protein
VIRARGLGANEAWQLPRAKGGQLLSVNDQPDRRADDVSVPAYSQPLSLTCWICGGIANSREHIFKAADLRRLFGSNRYAPDNLPFHFAVGGPGRIQGPKSDRVKYPRLICLDCNNQRTALFDRAYDELSSWFAKSQEGGGAASLNFSEVFGSNWVERIEHLRRYCAKALGCRIVAAGCKLPDYFPNPVSGDNLDILAISVCRTQPFRSLPNYESDLFTDLLGKGDLLANISRSHLETTGEREIRSAVWWENVGHFQINYWLAIRPNPKLGEPIDGSRKSYRLLQNDLDLAGMQNELSTWIASSGPLYSGVDYFTRPLAIGAWSEYLSSRSSNPVTQSVCVAELVSNLQGAIQRAKAAIDREVLIYRAHADLERVMSVFKREGRHLVRVTGRTLGYMDRVDGDRPELVAGVAATVNGSYFEPICAIMHRALAAIFEQQADQTATVIEHSSDLCLAMLHFADVMGFVLREITGGDCYVDIPFRLDNSKPEMRATKHRFR